MTKAENQKMSVLLLSSTRGLLLPALDDAIVRFMHEAEYIYIGGGRLFDVYSYSGNDYE